MPQCAKRFQTNLFSYSDKYAAFSKLDKDQQGHKGWSGKISVGSTGPMGWSDEILGLSTDEEEEGIEPRPTHLTIGAFNRPSWDRSPNRSFVRNFP